MVHAVSDSRMAPAALASTRVLAGARAGPATCQGDSTTTLWVNPYERAQTQRHRADGAPSTLIPDVCPRTPSAPLAERSRDGMGRPPGQRDIIR